jgi:hypothetical protein
MQRAAVGEIQADLQEQGRKHLDACEVVRNRLASGVAWLATDENAALAFKLANLAMSLQHSWDPEKGRRGPLVWRPFQLAFMLLAAPSSVAREHPDRCEMDLLWFPTGGGKTEAYLALIAFVAFYRRLASPGSGGGVAAIMRYTLRLLTTQQFVRASALIFACELIRRGRVRSPAARGKLGETPFSIGLWVGGDATPNSYQAAERALGGDLSEPSPAQLADCPACRRRLR